MTRLRAAFALGDPGLVPRLFDDAALARLHRAADLAPEVVTAAWASDDARDDMLAGVELLITGWGAPPLDAALLRSAPRLRVVVHTAGTVKSLMTPAAWGRGVRVSTAACPNARPVAEYTLAMVLLAGKGVLTGADEYARHRTFAGVTRPDAAGNHGLTVGVVGASRTGRQVIGLLSPFDVDVLLYDPWVDDAGAAELGARAVPLDELVRRSDVVTVHAPDLPETYRMIGDRELALMRDGATLINTARGRLVDTEALTREVCAGRLRAVLDVTDPEPLPAQHPLFDAPGALLTPHLAGSQGNELRRLGDHAVAEVERLARGETLEHEVHAHQLATTA